MRQLELLAPARDYQIGIAAIDCGADAVYIAGPQFGARQAAGNEVEDIRRLCEYAHRFGVRIFVTLNTILYDDELEAAYRQMIAVQEAGADAIIVQDMAIVAMAQNGIGDIRQDIHIPLHASTQCAIRTPDQARYLESLGFSRLILERELSLQEINEIRKAVTCELEFFVHGALCVCYSGQCYISEKIAGRSANRGACIQACRSRYDLVDEKGKILVKDKALLSLKDYNLKARLAELAEAGITSFKIEGRLKNESYVKNVVRDYSIALDDLISRSGDTYVRGSFGKVYGGFTPDTRKTFNRGYTELYIDGKRGRWASMDAAKSMGEEIGIVKAVNHDKSRITLEMKDRTIDLVNGDGFSFVAKDGTVTGFRGDVCSGNTITCKPTPSLFTGARIFRNISAAFEKELEKQKCSREILVSIKLTFPVSGDAANATAVSEDGRTVAVSFEAGNQIADNQERMQAMFESQLGKSTGHFRFSLIGIESDGPLPFMSASAINAIRRQLAEQLEVLPCIKRDLLLRDIHIGDVCSDKAQKASYKYNISNRLSNELYLGTRFEETESAYELSHREDAELMRTRYCIRYELGLCPVHQKGSRPNLPANLRDTKADTPLFLLNNGQRFSLHFDCKNCEMVVK